MKTLLNLLFVLFGCFLGTMAVLVAASVASDVLNHAGNAQTFNAEPMRTHMTIGE